MTYILIGLGWLLLSIGAAFILGGVVRFGQGRDLETGEEI